MMMDFSRLYDHPINYTLPILQMRKLRFRDMKRLYLRDSRLGSSRVKIRL